MEFHREHAIFDGSRLYRQAAEGSARLWDAMQWAECWSTVWRVLESECLPRQFQTASEVGQYEKVLRRTLANEISQLSSYHVLPMMFQVITDAYARQSPKSGGVTDLVPAAKTVAVRLAQAAAGHHGGRSSALTQVLRCVRLAAGELFFRGIRSAYHLCSGGGVVTPDGIHFDEAFGSVAAGLSYAFNARGRLQRFSGRAPTLMFSDPDAFLHDVVVVLAGAEPARCPAFAGTYLADLPSLEAVTRASGEARVKAEEYWCRLAARLQVLSIAHDVSRQVSRDVDKISIFGMTGFVLAGPALRRLTPRVRQRLQQARHNCCWTPKWLRTVGPGTEHHAFIERPVAPLPGEGPLWVTSPHNVADSITRLTETAVTAGDSGPSYGFPDQIFEKLLSGPFEQELIATFRQAGFIAGEVTKSGAWKTQEGVLNIAGAVPKGQIDMLAWHASGDVIVADCKVLRLPDSDSLIRNLWQRLESFQGPLREHRAWCEIFLRALGRTVQKVQAAVVLDRPLHFMQPDNDVAITDIDLVRQELQRFMDAFNTERNAQR